MENWTTSFMTSIMLGLLLPVKLLSASTFVFQQTKNCNYTLGQTKAMKKSRTMEPAIQTRKIISGKYVILAKIILIFPVLETIILTTKTLKEPWKMIPRAMTVTVSQNFNLNFDSLNQFLRYCYRYSHNLIAKISIGYFVRNINNEKKLSLFVIFITIDKFKKKSIAREGGLFCLWSLF